jgi:hypothetical protein
MDLQDQAQVLAGLQRSKTYNELSALRAELKQMQDKEAAAPKCPYCFGPIVRPAVKCRHCASNIEWWVFEGETGPAKEGDAKNIEAQMLVEMRKEIAERERREKELGETFVSKLTEFEKRFSLNCTRCKMPHKFETEKDLSEAWNSKGFCSACVYKRVRNFFYVLLLFIVCLFVIYFKLYS